LTPASQCGYPQFAHPAVADLGTGERWRIPMNSEKVCCNCGHKISIVDGDGYIVAICTYRHEILGYVGCVSGKCKHWSDRKDIAIDDLLGLKKMAKEKRNG